MRQLRGQQISTVHYCSHCITTCLSNNTLIPNKNTITGELHEGGRKCPEESLLIGDETTDNMSGPRVGHHLGVNSQHATASYSVVVVEIVKGKRGWVIEHKARVRGERHSRTLQPQQGFKPCSLYSLCFAIFSLIVQTLQNVHTMCYSQCMCACKLIYLYI